MTLFSTFPCTTACGSFLCPYQDTAAEGPETFFVNLTSVELVSVVPQGGAAPSIKNGQSVAEITIRQNDNANGILQFSAVKVSIEGDCIF